MDLEKDVEKHLKSQISKRGGLSLKWTSTVRGVPDQIICLPNGDTVFVEVKKPDGQTRKSQDKMIRTLQDLHQTVFVCYTKMQVDTLVRDLERIGCFNRGS
ncbi:VRR-NUC domain-containing protein [Enterococcus sp. 2201sp1_2201st1_B8_2201SCRN_220225]|uniref:VRR-NUC domain-containing protein n=1 Tax=unclassified Enterococcus TaxID=2608891 RepID=UPI0034A0EACF